MKRFFELKFGKDGKSDYDALDRRGPVEPDFSFCEKTIPSKTSGATSHGDSRRKSDAMPVQPVKKVKLNTANSKVESTNEVEKENVKPFDLAKLKKECEDLSGKLRNVEEIVMGSQEPDEVIMARLREFFGVKTMGVLQSQKGAAENGYLDIDEENLLANDAKFNAVEQAL